MPWSTHTVAGHPVDVYLPPRRNEHGDVLLYLHGLHENRLNDKQAFLEQFDKHGLAVVVPFTKRSWWTDKICREFDANISAQRHVLENVLPFIQRELGAAAHGGGDVSAGERGEHALAGRAAHLAGGRVAAEGRPREYPQV